MRSFSRIFFTIVLILFAVVAWSLQNGGAGGFIPPRRASKDVDLALREKLEGTPRPDRDVYLAVRLRN